MIRICQLAALGVATIALSGCAASEPPGPSASPAAADTPSSTPVDAPWNDVTDGTWSGGDLALGQPATARLSDYAISITAVPTTTTRDGGATIKMSAPLSITRTEDRGYGDDITDSERVYFVPGNYGYPQHNESYGINPDFVCISEQLAVGEATTCTVSFIAPAHEIQNSYWEINGKKAAAWPGQLP